MTTTAAIDLPIDLQTMDETGLPWTFLDEAADPSRIVPGAHVVAGSGSVRAVVVVVDVTEEGIVHVCDVPGSVEDNAHLLEYRNDSRAAVSERLPEDLPAPAETGGTRRDALGGTGRNSRRLTHDPKFASSSPAPAANHIQRP